MKTPTPPLPDYNIMANREAEFEVQNKMLGIWYSETSYRLFLQLQEDIIKYANLDVETTDWKFKAQNLRDRIDQVEDSFERGFLITRWEEIVHISRKKPVTKAPTFLNFVDVLKETAESLPSTSEKALEAAGLSKKKFKNEEEEKKFHESVKEKIEEELASKLLNDIHLDEARDLAHQIVNDQKYRFSQGEMFFDKLSRIKNPKDIEIEGKRVLAKYSLKVKMDKCNFCSI